VISQEDDAHSELPLVEPSMPNVCPAPVAQARSCALARSSAPLAMGAPAMHLGLGVSDTLMSPLPSPLTSTHSALAPPPAQLLTGMAAAGSIMKFDELRTVSIACCAASVASSRCCAFDTMAVCEVPMWKAT